MEENCSAIGENIVGLLSSKQKCSRLDLNESREGFGQGGRGRSFQVEGLQTEKAREALMESLIQGTWST